MKPLILTLFTITSLCGASPELPNPMPENFALASPSQPELISLEIPSTNQLVMTPNEMTLPSISPIPIKKEPWVAVTLSAILPGLGHVYLGDMSTAGGLMGTTGLSMGVLFSPLAAEAATLQTTVATLQATSFYSWYASYRDARILNGISSYSYQMPTDSLAQLTTASFNWRILKKPEVWGGLLGTLALGTAIVHFAYPENAKITSASASSSHVMPWVALPVGLGEESFFRGFLQSALSETFNPLTGIILSSLLFGAAHIPNAQGLEKAERWRYYTFSLPLITGIGAYCGWLTNKNHSLQESVALHTWYDFIIFSISALATETAATGRPGFAFAVPF
jgi:membrane protease YdiL (CAAX protease family)